MQRERKQFNVAFAGNPNCGKTTLFNAITGANLKVANWPGVTVEKKEGKTVFRDITFNLIDLPGTYSLNSYTLEEKVTKSAVLDESIDLIVNVVDASNLERNLYLTLQLIETGKPIIVALNMIDIVKSRGIRIDTEGLSNTLGLSVIPVSAKKKTGLNSLMREVYNLALSMIPVKTKIRYGAQIEGYITQISDNLQKDYPNLINTRWYAIKTVEGDDEVISEYPTSVKLPASLSYDIVNERYDFISELVKKFVQSKSKKVYPTDKIDKLLTHNTYGILIFFLIMSLVFTLTFTFGNLLKSYLENFFSKLSDIVFYFLTSIDTAPWLVSLIVDGILAGVFGILSFLPNIAILFLLLGFLEDSGYMARIAYIMDGIMNRLGLGGKAFIPLILGFGCSVPAIMATRTLSSEKERRDTIKLIPFMSCSAKIPIYILFSGIFFKQYEILAAISMYFTGILVGVISAKIKNRVAKNKGNFNLLIELPEYKTPSFRSVFIYANTKVKEYIKKAGSVIFVASIILWTFTNLNSKGLCGIEESFAATFGKKLVPFFSPIGLGYWQIIVSLIAGLAAKEVVVSSLVIIYGSSYLDIAGALHRIGFTKISAISMMMFCLLYVPCIAAMATVQSETKSVGFTLKLFFTQNLVAWFISFVVYNFLIILFG